MGACTFFTVSKGKTADAAFSEAVYTARYEYGHGGYTGTIAEKHDFIMIELPKGAVPVKYAEQLIDDGDPRIDDKWGPAGCIEMPGNKYLFFGWASF